MEPKEPGKFLDELIERYPILESVKENIWRVYEMMEACYERGGKVLIAGNGGSSADAEHIVGELMKGFKKSRSVSPEFADRLRKADGERAEELIQKLQGALPAISLSSHPALCTAYLNDVDGDLILAQQVYGYGKKEDVFLGISTSGNAKNIMYAVAVAKAKGMKVAALTGKDGGALGRAADESVIVPEPETYRIQELHLPIYHVLCLMLEERFF
ncbi:SIS domain-containing protein [Lachnospiraceae bacterium 62-35]